MRSVIAEGAAAKPGKIDRVRDGMMRFILAHWTVVRPQLTCPAKSGDPRSCYNCHDMQVLACVADQYPPNQEGILK